MKHSPRFLELVYKAKSRIEEATVHDIETRLANKERLQILDVREESEWQQARIPGSTHLGRGVLERDIEKTFPDLEKKWELLRL